MMPIQNGQMVHQMTGLIVKSEKNNPWVDNPGIFIFIQLRRLGVNLSHLRYSKVYVS